MPTIKYNGRAEVSLFHWRAPTNFISRLQQLMKFAQPAVWRRIKIELKSLARMNVAPVKTRPTNDDISPDEYIVRSWFDPESPSTAPASSTSVTPVRTPSPRSRPESALIIRMWTCARYGNILIYLKSHPFESNYRDEIKMSTGAASALVFVLRDRRARPVYLQI